MNYFAMRCQRCDAAGDIVILTIHGADRWICRECEYSLKLWWLKGHEKATAKEPKA